MRYFRFSLLHEPEIIAGVDLLFYQVVLHQVHTLNAIKESLHYLDLSPDVQKIEGPLYSGNLETREGSYLIFQNLTEPEVMELKDEQFNTIRSYLERMSPEDQQKFYTALNRDHSLETEVLDTWKGSSLHIQRSHE